MTDSTSITTFNTLAPIIIQEFENYLPTAFDNNLTMLQKVNKIIQSLSTTNDTVNSLITQWNDQIVPYVNGDGFQTDVNNKLDAMASDGTLASLLDAKIGGKIDSLSLYNSDYSTLQSALTDAYTKNLPLQLGNNSITISTYVSNIHDVVLKGFASIIRGTDTFYVNPIFGETNKLYISPLGNDTWDGLTSDRPIKTLGKAIQILEHYKRPMLQGKWEIHCASGTYNEAVTVDYLVSNNQIKIIGAPTGGHPVVPATVFSMGTGASAVGLMGRYGVNFYVQDIKFSGYNGTTSSGGIVVAYGSKLETNNVHTDSCYYGISGEHQSSITIPDGLHTNNGYLNGQTTGSGASIRSLQQTNHYIGTQNGGDLSKGFVIDGGSNKGATGFFAQELSTGHVNWGTIKNCSDGVHALVMSRANLDGVSFSSNVRDIRTDTNSHVYITTNTSFDGTSQQTIALESGGQLTGNPSIAEYDTTYSTDFKTYALQYLNQTIKTNSASVFHTSTLKFPHWLTLNNTIAQGKIIRFKILGTLNGATNIKRINIRLNDGTNNIHTGLTFSASDTGSFFCEGEIQFVANGKQIIACRGARHLEQSIQVLRSDSTVPMNKDTVFTLEASVDDTTSVDSVVIDSCEVSLAG